MASEIAYIPLAAGLDLKDPNSEAAAVWRATINTISSQPLFQTLYYGMCVEKPSLLQLIIDWDSVEDHIKFTKSDGYADFIDRIKKVIDPAQAVNFFHVHWTSHPPKVPIAAPVTECIKFHMPASTSAADKQKYEENVLEFSKRINKHAHGFKGLVGGWAVENLEYDGQKTLVYAFLLGWTTVDAHMAFRETEAFKDAIPLVRTGLVGAEMHHVVFDDLKG